MQGAVENKDESKNSALNEKYIIQIENFEGPMDLLWTLIKKSKIDIVEVSISEITDQYIKYLKLMEELNISVATEFILMASELLYYKSKALLPSGEIEDEYFVPPLPPELVEKLLEYKKYQLSALKLKDSYDRQADSYTRENDLSRVLSSNEYVTMSLFDLLNVFVDVLESQKTIEEKEIKFDEILVSDRIDFIKELLNTREEIPFNEIFSKEPSRSELIATFLAMLELAKMTRVKIVQHKIFGDILLLRNFDPNKENNAN